MKLTETQSRVMSYMRHKHEATNLRGKVIEINGQHVCNESTMVALAKMGLVQFDGKYSWKATAAGLAQQAQGGEGR